MKQIEIENKIREVTNRYNKLMFDAVEQQRDNKLKRLQLEREIVALRVSNVKLQSEVERLKQLKEADLRPLYDMYAAVRVAGEDKKESTD